MVNYLKQLHVFLLQLQLQGLRAVSYTHLDVYKRQVKLSDEVTETLVTNIYDETLDTSKFKELYFLRWGDVYKRQAIIRALITDPKIVLMDEPTSGLDIVSRNLIRKYISGLKDKTIVITSHVAEDIEALCNKVIILKKGNVYEDTDIEKLKVKYKANSCLLYTLDVYKRQCYS